MTTSNTATQLQGLDLNSVDPKTLVGVIMELKAKVEELESKGKADPGTAWLNTPGPNFRISEAQKANGFWTVTDMIMDQDYKKGDVMTVTLWKPSEKAPNTAIGRLTTQPKWTGEEPVATDDDDLSVL
jgi:hypothetical protein